MNLARELQLAAKEHNVRKAEKRVPGEGLAGTHLPGEAPAVKPWSSRSDDVFFVIFGGWLISVSEFGASRTSRTS